ncbi:MAG TPA: hypothetical protein VFV95_03575 [Vicinamibacterales bacterium]|nr:hypothetical protein [Vicinamibacterales bacterium]
MQLTRHFRFKGYASALSGLLYVPRTTVIDLDCGSCALGVTGGRARAEVKSKSFGDAVRIASAATFAEGLFDDEKRARAVVSHKGRQDELTTTTTVGADVREMSVGNNEGPFLTVKRLRATLVSRSPDGSGEPRIVPAKETAIEGVAVDEYGLTITLNLPFFQTNDTRSKLMAAADDRKLSKAHRKSLAMDTTVEGQPAEGPARLISSQDVLYTTIVREIKWTGKPFPGARIDEHTVIVPEFGRIFFGELLISAAERRLTMVRCELGSPLRGYVGGGDVGSNGSWYP